MIKFLMMATAASTLVCAPAGAKSKSDNTLRLPAAAAVKVTVALSDDLLYRADNLPKKLRDRGRARGLNNGWSGNGYYGLRDLNRLKDDVSEELLEDFAKANIRVSEAAPYELRITLVDAKPTRPTFKQLSKQPGLSHQSIGNGGATFTAQMIGPSGTVIGTSEYDWYESFLGNNFGIGQWSDARRAIRYFARDTAKHLTARN